MRTFLRAVPLHVRETMKSRKPSHRDILSSCSEIRPDDGIDPRTFFGKSERKKSNHKNLQMCGEIARTLSLVLAWESGDDLLQALIVESVQPAPDSSRVLVTVRVQPRAEVVDIGQVQERLHQCRGRFRTEVAAAIHRKRVPELVFRVLSGGEVNP